VRSTCRRRARLSSRDTSLHVTRDRAATPSRHPGRRRHRLRRSNAACGRAFGAPPCAHRPPHRSLGAPLAHSTLHAALRVPRCQLHLRARCTSPHARAAHRRARPSAL
jgi:hypothetical protein